MGPTVQVRSWSKGVAMQAVAAESASDRSPTFMPKRHTWPRWKPQLQSRVPRKRERQLKPQQKQKLCWNPAKLSTACFQNQVQVHQQCGVCEQLPGSVEDIEADASADTITVFFILLLFADIMFIHFILWARQVQTSLGCQNWTRWWQEAAAARLSESHWSMRFWFYNCVKQVQWLLSTC